MKKEAVTTFNLEAAFKALDEIEIPKVNANSRYKTTRVNLHERLNSKAAHEVLLEDYFDISSEEDLTSAQEERSAEIAKAKLARIEKIVDLDAESEEDILPSYVGKIIMQCPQCMTLFYKSEEDIEKSEETPDVVNINETCQHCGNTSGYTLVGKVGGVDEAEAENFDLDEVEVSEDELAAEGEEAAPEGVEGDEEILTGEESTEEETPAEEEEFDLNLEDESEETEGTEEEEETNESIHRSQLLKAAKKNSDLKSNIDSEQTTLLEEIEDNALVIHTKEEAEAIIDESPELKNEYDELYPFYENGDLDHDFEYGNFFNLYDAETDTVDESKIVIQWSPDDDEASYEVIVDSLDAAVVAIRDIEAANGNIAPRATNLNIEEGIGDWYRKTFDRPASTTTQQWWEAELNNEFGEISPERRKELEDKFARQRDWERRHGKTPDVPSVDDQILRLTKDAYDNHLDGSESGKQQTEAEMITIGENAVAKNLETYEDFDEVFNAHVSAYLSEVYSNVASYETTNCTISNGKLIVEGIINFASGKQKATKFVFKPTANTKNGITFKGLNESFSNKASAFELKCKAVNKELVTESFKYKYKIEESKVTGLITRG